MGALKRAARQTLAAVGLQAVCTSGAGVPYATFLNLTQAYEQRLNEMDSPVPENERRPRLLAQLRGTPPSEAYFIVQALAQSQRVDGDVCEFGVAQGETSALIANEIAPSGSKTLHLFDSFEGLPKPSEKDELKNDIFSLGSIEAYAGTMSYPEDMVRARLGAMSFPERRYVIHKGFMDQVIKADEGLPGKVSFAYVDFDFYEPTRLALEYLHGATGDGAVIIVDDYDFFSTGPKKAVDEFVQARRPAGTHFECLVPDLRYGCFAVLTKSQQKR